MSDMPRQNLLGPLLYTFKKLKDRKVKQVVSEGWYEWEGEGIRKG
jgi:hypothetical protein